MSQELMQTDGVLECRAPEKSSLASDAANLSRPNLSAVYYACAQIYGGNAEHGLDVLKTVYKNIHVDCDRPFNQPFEWDLGVHAPTGACQDRHMASLAVWHALFALEVFFLSVPDNTLYLRPNLPKGVEYLNAPIFTPVGLGSLSYHVRTAGGYIQTAKIEFESPIHIQHIKLAAPREYSELSVSMLCDGDVGDARSSVERGGERNTVHIELTQPFFIRDSVSVTLKEKKR
jgi:hypothetical protein